MPEATGQQNTVETWALMKAIERHDEDKVKELITAGVDVSVVDDQRRPALICALENNVNFNIIKALVEEGKAKVNARDPRFEKRTSLFYAVTRSKETAAYLFKEAKPLFNKLDVPNILAFYIENLCTTRNMHDSGPTVDDIFRILKDTLKDSQPSSLADKLADERADKRAHDKLAGKLASSIASILLCKSPLLIASDSHRPQNARHSMFHLHEKRNFLLDTLKKVSDCESFKNYPKKESIKKVLRMLREKEPFSGILDSLKEHGADPDFADSYGNTVFHYAACLPWMGVSQETTKEICTQLNGCRVPLNAKNHQDQTPLLFCLSGSMEHLEEEEKVKSMKALVEVCKFLVTNGSALTETTKNEGSVFHLVMKLFQQGLEIPDQTIRQGVIDATMNLLHSFTATPKRVEKIVQKRGGELLNSPLHLWASLALTVRVKDYASFGTQENAFATFLEEIFKHLTKCKALKNDRNKDEETPLHVCTTWSAVTLLIKNGANPNDVDSKKRPPLLAAASKKTFLQNPSHFYPDVQEEANSFFKKAIEEMKLDPWAFDDCNNSSNSVLSFLIASGTFDLSKALVEVARDLKDQKSKCREIFVSLLKAICKDESLHTNWKPGLVQTLLECAKTRSMNVVKEPFDVCCQTLCDQIGNGPPPSINGKTEESSDATNDALPCSNNGQVQPDDLDNDGSTPPAVNVATEGGGEPPPPNRTAEQSAPICSTIHCKIAKMLRKHGAELCGPSYEALKTKCSEIDDILQDTEVDKELVPWTSESERHKPVLEKVASRQECQEIGESICCHKPFGADPLVGINKHNSREVAIKRITETQCTQDLKNLYAKLDCKHVIRYFLHLENNEDKIVYIVFELMEGNLDDYLKSRAFDSSKGTSLCQDIVKGLNYLHNKDVCHFQDHLKPTSIFYKTHPSLCLKITDFDNQPIDETSVYVWSSPELLTRGVDHQCKSSDVFCCGLLLHYILSKGKHPFSSPGCTNRSETESKIKDDEGEVDDSLSPEGAYLVKQMLRNNQKHRPTAAKSLDHPLFWPKTKMLDILFAVGNQPEFECPRGMRTPPLTAVETDVQSSFSTIVKHGKWNHPGYTHMPAIYKEMMLKRKTAYDPLSTVELVRCIRNAIAHVSGSSRSAPRRKQLLEDFVFLEYFPDLVMEVYKAVTTHGWDQTREEIKYAMKK